MRKILLIASREFAENARTKGFIFSLILFPLILVMATQVPILLEDKGVSTRRFVIADLDGQFREPIQQRIQERRVTRVREEALEYFDKRRRPDAPESARERIQSWDGSPPISELMRSIGPDLADNAPNFEAPKPRFQIVELPEEVSAATDPEIVADLLKPYLNGAKNVPNAPGDLFAAIIVPPSPATNGQSQNIENQIQYWSKNVADSQLLQTIRDVVNLKARQRAIAESGMDPKTVDNAVNAAFPIVELNPAKSEGQEKVDNRDRFKQWAPSAFVYLLWVSIFTTMQLLLNSTIEEKSNRLVEALLSAVRVRQLMIGKLIGSAATGGTMVGVWILSLVLLMQSNQSSPTAELTNQIVDVVSTTGLLPAFFVYFFLGYLTFASVFLMVGSMCNTIKEAQNYVSLLTMILIIPLFTMTYIPRDPHGTLAMAMSWFPLYTPFAMLNRIGANPPAWEIAGTLILSIATILTIFWIAERVFKASILRTSGPPKWAHVWRAIRGADSEN